MKNSCPLCGFSNNPYIIIKQKVYFDCIECKGIYLSPKNFLDDESEKNIYLKHVNDINDFKYQAFTKPIWSTIEQYFSKCDSLGLDYGSGTGPVISHVLKRKGFNVKQYDPYFANQPELLNLTYDYIFSCEVVEHFHSPFHEFQRFKEMLSKDGLLLIMTDIYRGGGLNEFQHWYYRHDPTHVFFYRESTFQYIQKKFGFSKMEIKDRLTRFAS